MAPKLKKKIVQESMNFIEKIRIKIVKLNENCIEEKKKRKKIYKESTKVTI